MVKKEELKNTEFQDKEEKENSKVKQFFEKSKAFLMRFKDVKEPIFSAKLGPVLQSRIEIVYLAGLVILGVYALVALFHFPNISEMFGGLIAVCVTFIIFRMLCEILAVSDRK